MLPERIRQYLLCDLEATPGLLGRVIAGVTDASDYDQPTGPGRFTPREVLAHLADWEDVFLQRIEQTRDGDRAMFVGLDPEQVARDHGYSQADPAECIARFRQRRQGLLAVLRSLTTEQWERVGTHAEIGPISLETQMVMVTSHDGYHLQQLLDALPV